VYTHATAGQLQTMLHKDHKGPCSAVQCRLSTHHCCYVSAPGCQCHPFHRQWMSVTGWPRSTPHQIPWLLPHFQRVAQATCLLVHSTAIFANINSIQMGHFRPVCLYRHNKYGSYSWKNHDTRINDSLLHSQHVIHGNNLTITHHRQQYILPDISNFP